MSITKVGKAKSSSDAVDYILKEEKNGEKQPEIIGGNVAGSNSQEIKDEFREQEKLNFKVKNTVTHISVSFPTDRNISNQIATDYADELAVKLGFEMNPYVVVRHFDKDNRSEDSYSHIHIVASRINNDGTTVSEWQIAERTIAATIEIDRKFELQSVEYQKVNQGEKAERNIKKNEYRIMQKTGKLSVLEEFKDVAEDAVRQIDEDKTENDQPNKTRFFIKKLQKSGFEVLPFISKDDGQMKGFSFKKDKIIFTASKAGKKFSWTNLATQLEYNSEKDLQFLVNLKDEVLAESDKNVSPTDENPSPNPSENESKEKAENTEQTEISVKTLSVKSNREEFSEPPETQKQTEKKVEKVEKENQPAVLKSYENRDESQEKQNEKTAEFTSDKPRIEPDKSINGNVQKELDFEKQIPKLAKSARNESASSVEKTEIIGEESAEIRSNRADHEAVGSGETVAGNEETTDANNADRKQEDRIKKERISNGRFSNSESNQHGKAGIERTELENSNIKKSFGRNNESSGNFRQESTNSEAELSEFQKTSREFESGISEGRESKRHLDSGDSDQAEQTSGSRKFEFESNDFATKSTDTRAENANIFISGGSGRSENSSEKKRKSIGEIRESSQEHTDSLNCPVGDNLSDSGISRDEPRISNGEHGTEPGFRHFAEQNQGIIKGSELPLQRESRNNTNVSTSQKLLQTAERPENQNDSSKRPTNRKTAEITAQVINVKFFSGQLDKKIVEKWKEVIENSDPQASLREIVKPQTNEEKSDLRKNLDYQAEYFAENLKLTKPGITEKTDTKKLATVLTKIEVNNFTETTKTKISNRTIQRLAKEKETLAKTPMTDEQIIQTNENTNEIPFRQIFSNKLEAAAFNSLLEPESVKFDKKNILETQEKVRVDEVAASETVRLIQIAYGGQCDKFTTEFKSDLSDQIYRQSATATEIYNNYRDFDWQKTVRNFTPLVNDLAEQRGITIQVPTDEAEKNKLLAQNLAQQIIKTYEERSKPVEKYIQDEILKSAVRAEKLQVQPIQSESILKATDSKLEPPEFKSSLEASFNNFDKNDDKEKSVKAEKVVKEVREIEERKIEKQRQLELNNEMEERSL